MPEKSKGAESAGGAGDVEATDFGHFVLMLASTALIHLGEMSDPTAKGIEKDPEQARRTIDILAMLQAKTKGNLTPEEASLLESLLHSLRLRYLKAVGFLQGSSA
jgi:hypothetical protein